MPSSRSKRKKPSKPARRPKENTKKSARRQRTSSAIASARSSSGRTGELFEELVAIQARLRAPGGCPWDREQTHRTLRTYLIEEAYEVLDAIEKGVGPDLSEELGDLLLQVLFHADLAREANTFDISDVIIGIRDKMIRRHPHVFGNVKAETSGEVLKNWAQLKAKEKQAASKGKRDESLEFPSLLEGIPRSLPGLLEAYQMTRRAAQVGFDWPNAEGILEKIEEEIGELREALAVSNRPAVEEELGDLLFSIVNFARFLRIDPEVILKNANLKFKRRFQWVESEVSHAGSNLADLPNEKLEELWAAAKSKEQARISKESGS